MKSGSTLNLLENDTVNVVKISHISNAQVYVTLNHSAEGQNLSGTRRSELWNSTHQEWCLANVDI